MDETTGAPTGVHFDPNADVLEVYRRLAEDAEEEEGESPAA